MPTKIFFTKEFECSSKTGPLKSTVSNKELLSSSHKAMAPVLLIAQCFALMPLDGITMPTAASLRFRWLSLRTAYNMILLLFVLVMSFASIIYGSSNPLAIRTFELINWNASKIIVIAILVSLARDWPTMMIHWENVELKLPKYEDMQRNWCFHRQIKWFTILSTIFIFIEHLMSVSSGLYRSSFCLNHTTLHAYFIQSYPQLSSSLANGWYTVLLIEFMNKYLAFMWSFLDILIVSISICLSTRFKQFNENLRKYKGLAMSSNFWSEQRGYYSMLSDLIVYVDQNLSMTITFAIFNNLYYILLQLLNTFQPKDTVIQNVYFWLSLLFLLSRMSLISLSAARINEESKKSLQVIRAIPADHYHIEARRFLEEVANSEIALTGRRFFYLKRSLLLSVAGTIVTYELVLIQFQVKLAETNKYLC